MFSVIFEVLPRKENWDDYLENAKMLRPELEQVDGFIDNIRYKSLTREGWILSLSNWRDEKSLVRWRTRMRHHGRLQRSEFVQSSIDALKALVQHGAEQVPGSCRLIRTSLGQHLNTSLQPYGIGHCGTLSLPLQH